MAEEDIHVVGLRDAFYRDSFGKVVLAMVGIVVAILLLIGLSLYFYLNTPPPITFHVGDEMRVLPPVPLDKPYLSEPELLQWVADVLPKTFDYDFNHYNDQLKDAAQYFTTDGWKIFLNQLNINANYTNVQAYKLFVNGTAAGAPFILRQGVIQESGRYGWWVQMPIIISYAGYQPPPAKTVNLQVLVVRVSTLNNLNGVGINNVILAP